MSEKNKMKDVRKIEKYNKYRKNVVRAGQMKVSLPRCTMAHLHLTRPYGRI